MEIGKKLKNARVQSGMTQENVAEKINVSRQTISNWENEKSYPDIISVIELSNLYSISLDVLLKGDEKMIEHLEESTNVVKSNQKMIWAIIVNIIVVALLITLNMFIPDNRYFLVGIFCLMVITSSALLYQIVLAVICGAVALVGAFCVVFQIYHMTVIDATARGLKHPKFWGVFTMSGNNSSGLLMYLIGRRKYPIVNMSESNSKELEKRKKSAGVGLLFLAIGVIGIICATLI